MNRAYLHASISTSLEVAELSILGQLVFERMFPHADSQGRLVGHPRKIKLATIPMVEASAEEVEAQLQRMADLGLIHWYEAAGGRYIQLTAWWKYQPRRFAHPSKYPAPPAWTDRLRYNDSSNGGKLVEENWSGHQPRGRKGTAADESYTGKPSPAQDADSGNGKAPPRRRKKNSVYTMPPEEYVEYVKAGIARIQADAAKLEEWRGLYPSVNIENEVFNAAGWLLDRTDTGEADRRPSITAFVGNWLRKANADAAGGNHAH